MNIKIVNEHTWSRSLLDSPYMSPFHEYTWLKLVVSSLGGRYYPVVIEHRGLQWLAPCYMESPWTTNHNQLKIGSIGYGGPLPTHRVNDPITELIFLNEILPELCNYFNKANLKASLYPLKAWSIVNDKLFEATPTVRIDLTNDIDELFEKKFSGSVRTAIRKSLKQNVEVREIYRHDPKELKEAYQVLINTQVRVGASYTTDIELFKSLCYSDMSKVFVATMQGTVVSVAALIFNQKESFHLFHGWVRETAKSCANQALIWSMIRFTAGQNIASFNMGESHSEDLLNAKLRWGGHTEPVLKMHYDVTSRLR